MDLVVWVPLLAYPAVFLKHALVGKPTMAVGVHGNADCTKTLLNVNHAE